MADSSFRVRQTKRLFLPVFGLLIALSTVEQTRADDATSAPASPTLRIGAVAYAPSAVTIFENLRRYMVAQGLPTDYVLYSNYDTLVAALARREIDIAWNTPLAHGKFHCLTDGACRTLVMRDVDCDFHSVLVARADSGIKSLADLAGHTIVLGSRDAAEATVLPLHFLRQQGCDLRDAKLLSLDDEVDLRGNPCSSEQHVLRAMLSKRGDAGIIGERLWKHFQESAPAEASQLQLVWLSPPFSHCVFSSHADLDEARAARFKELMLAMRPQDERCAEVLRLEGAQEWVAGSDEGFKELITALEKVNKTD